MFQGVRVMKILMAAAASVLLTAAAQPRGPAPQPRAPAPQPAPVQARPQPAQPVMRASVRVLLGLCASDNGACISYVAGAADAWTSAAASLGRPPLFCFPAGTSNLQITQSAIQYLRARPQEGDANAAAVLLGAFTTIYPCPR
jgi:hypothetical protein